MEHTYGPALSWRLVHDGLKVLALFESEGYTETVNSVFESQTRAGCVTEIKRLGLTADNIELTEAEVSYLQAVAQDVPDVVDAWQAKTALEQDGLLLEVESEIMAMTGAAGASARKDWYSATKWRRDWPLVLAMQQKMGWTDDYVDRLFITASNL